MEANLAPFVSAEELLFNLSCVKLYNHLLRIATFKLDRVMESFAPLNEESGLVFGCQAGRFGCQSLGALAHFCLLRKESNTP